MADFTVQVTLTSKGYTLEAEEGRTLNDAEWKKVANIAIGAVQQHDQDRREAAEAAAVPVAPVTDAVYGESA